MKRLTITAALFAMPATLAFADAHMSDDTRWEMHRNTADNGMSSEDIAGMEGGLIRSRDITGGAVYSMAPTEGDAAWNPQTMHDDVGADWEQIGEIEDLVLNEDGKVIGVVAEVGGFLDIGDKHVAISVSDLNLVAVDDANYAYVTRLSEETLEEMDGVDEGFWN